MPPIECRPVQKSVLPMSLYESEADGSSEEQNMVDLADYEQFNFEDNSIKREEMADNFLNQD